MATRSKYLESVPEEARCTAKAKARSGSRCRNPAVVGARVCRMHGGAAPQVLEKRSIELARREMALLRIDPIDEDDAEARGDVALTMEIRRTVAWIRFCTDRISELDSAERLIYGQSGDSTKSTTSRKTGVDGEDPVDVTEEATETAVANAADINGWVELLNWNRRHLASLSAIWIKAGFEAKRLEMETGAVERFDGALVSVVMALGHDPHDPSVRAAISGVLVKLAG
jgi:hypothetical protein